MLSKKILNFIVALLAIGTTLSFLLHFSECINVEILENVGDYPFGTEGPVAGVKHYKDANSYSNAMLHFTLSNLFSSMLLWWGIFKETILFVYTGIIVIILDLILLNLIY
ncbi:MAG: hypothetical protein COA97_04085 [Flavobacteriales bacterium]|nr:MAG: hypothetical protein COA97_04085 [Flavobacteriales bacterium]